MDMRGLHNFIKEIRQVVNNRELELQRVEKEMAKIRVAFTQGNLSAYDRKKYVCKLLFIHILGYEVSFGHMEALQLLHAKTYAEKVVGYLVVNTMLSETSELLMLCTQSMKKDLGSNNEVYQCMSLTAIANVGGKLFVESLANDVLRLVKQRLTPYVHKKALLTLLAMFRKYPEMLQPTELAAFAAPQILNREYGVANAALTLLLGLATPETVGEMLNLDVRNHAISLLHRVVILNEAPADYKYVSTPAPWLQVKALRLLQNFDCPADVSKIGPVILAIFRGAEKLMSKTQTTSRLSPAEISRHNAVSAVLIEAMSLVIHYDNDLERLDHTVRILSKFLAEKRDPNLRYYGLLLMSRLSFSNTLNFADEAAKHMSGIVGALSDPDVSIKKSALSLLYTMCDSTNAGEIVGELVESLATADHILREEVVLMIAVLSENFANDLVWYIDIILNVITKVPDHVTDDVWHRLCHIISNTTSVQEHAAEVVFWAVHPPTAHETVVKIAAYVLGEFGYKIARNKESSPITQFNVLNAKFGLVSNSVKAVLLTCYVKFYNLYDNSVLREKILRVFRENRGHLDVDVQQRASEYLNIVSVVSDDTLQEVLDSLPPLELQADSVVSKLKERHKGAERNVWLEKSEEREKASKEASNLVATLQAEEHRRADELAKQQQELEEQQRRAVELQKKVAAMKTDPKPVHSDPMDSIFGGDAGASNRQRGDTVDAVLGGLPPDPASNKQQVNQHGTVDELFGSGTPSPQPTSDPIEENFTAFAYNNGQTRGQLYSSSDVEVQMAVEVQGPDARMMIALLNKTPGPLTHLAFSIQHTPHGAIFQMQPHAPEAQPGEKMLVNFAARCTNEFAGNPTLLLRYVAQTRSTPVSVSLNVPIILTKFCEPYKVTSPGEFMKLWNSLPPSGGYGAPSACTLPHNSNVVTVANTLRDHCSYHTLEASSNSVVGVLAHAMHPTGANASFVPVLLNVDVQGSVASVSVRSTSPLLVEAYTQHALKALSYHGS